MQLPGTSQTHGDFGPLQACDETWWSVLGEWHEGVGRQTGIGCEDSGFLQFELAKSMI
jgi:hypothetical protein